MHVDHQFIILSEALYTPRTGLRRYMPGTQYPAIRGWEVEVLSVGQLIESRCQKILTLSEEVAS